MNNNEQVGTALSDQELITSFFQKLNPKQALELSHQFRTAFPSLSEFKGASQQQRLDLVNSGVEELQLMLIGIELGRRVARSSRPVLGKIFSSRQIGQILIDEFQDDFQENLCLICLDVKHRILRQQVVFRGTLTTCPVHPREIFSIAIDCHAESIVVAHNHPSGVTEPSENDIAFTKRLNQCGQLLGVTLLDSFVIGQNDYLSMREAQLMD